MIGLVRVVVRAILMIIVTFYYVAMAVYATVFHKKTDPYRVIKVSQGWVRSLIKVMGIKVNYLGQAPDENVLILPSHRSYIDILLLPQYFICTFVAKAEVRKWPGVGLGAHLIESVFVNRKSKESRIQTRMDIKDRFDKGISVVVFPEGTTTWGPKVKELRNGIFQVASAGVLPVMPVAIEYQNQDAAWVGDDKFFPHFFRIFGRRHIHVTVKFGDVLRSDDWRVLRNDVTDWLNANLLEIREQYDQEQLVKA